VVFPAAVPGLEEPLVLALELVVQQHATDATAAPVEPFPRAQVGAIDLGVVREFAGLPDARGEGLAARVAVIVAVAPVGLEKLPTLRGERDDPRAWGGQRSPEEPLGLEMRNVLASGG
jgi:hypothetical protein